MVKIGSLIKKGLESLVAPVLIGAGAFFGSYQEVKAQDTNNPSYFILYAQADQVNWSDPSTLNPTNTNIWKKNYTAYAPGYGGYTNNASLNILVGSFLNSGKVSSPVLNTEKMKSSQYSYALTDINQTNEFSVIRGIVATNGVWQGKSMNRTNVVTKITDYGDGKGYFDVNNLGFGGLNTNWVTGIGLSSAIQISLNDLQMVRNETLTFEPALGSQPSTVFFVSGSKSAPDQFNFDPDPGSITFIPEPSTYILLGGGLSALAWRRRRRNGEKVNKDLISAKAKQYAEDIERRG